MPSVSFIVSLRSFCLCCFIYFWLFQGTAWSCGTYCNGCDLKQQIFLPTFERALTTDLNALVKAVLTVVLAIAQPLFGDALVL